MDLYGREIQQMTSMMININNNKKALNYWHGDVFQMIKESSVSVTIFSGIIFPAAEYILVFFNRENKALIHSLQAQGGLNTNLHVGSDWSDLWRHNLSHPNKVNTWCSRVSRVSNRKTIENQTGEGTSANSCNVRNELLFFSIQR